MMNYLDFIIIYLACGSPFGVYYFFNNRQTQKYVIVKSVLITIFWIFYAVKLLHLQVTKWLINNDFENKNSLDSRFDEKLLILQKKFETFSPQNQQTLSLFEIREIIERYSGLTTSKNNFVEIPTPVEKELYKINGNKKVEISALCLKRRNQSKLLFHQIQARLDFLKLLRKLLEINYEQKKLGELAIKFAKILNDERAVASIKQLIKEFSQTAQEPTVKQLEKELWTAKTEQPQLKTKTVPLRFQTLATTINQPKKD